MDEKFMKEALDEARKAYEIGEVPIGAVVVRGGEVVARAHNLRETQKDPTAHAEVLAMRRASEALGGWRLFGCELYVTIEPCPMCAGAAVNARIDRIVYGATDAKAGACHTLYEIPQDERLNHRCVVQGGVLQEECAAIMSAFFAERRADKKKERES